MLPTRRLAAFLLALLVASVSILAVAPPAAAVEQAVTIKDFAYAPANIQINAGDTVTWTNLEAIMPHDVSTIIPGEPEPVLPFQSPILQSGESFSFTFTQPGVYQYYCSLHPNMLGHVTVVG
jgi:plastocyanin